MTGWDRLEQILARPEVQAVLTPEERAEWERLTKAKAAPAAPVRLPRCIRIIAGPVEIRAQPGQFATPVATYPRQSGEVMTVGRNVSEAQARELIESGHAVDAYGGAPFWRTWAP